MVTKIKCTEYGKLIEPTEAFGHEFENKVLKEKPKQNHEYQRK